MIVESGADLHSLLDEERLANGDLLMIALDADMRPLWVKGVASDFRGRFDPHVIAAVEKRLAKPAVRYVALGHAVGDVAHHRDHHFGEARIDRLEQAISRRRKMLLGVIICDGERWASSGPMHSFEHYPEGESVPRAITIPPPHPPFTCGCAYCAPRNARPA